MSNEEHLIESALEILFKSPNAYRTESYEEFAKPPNTEMAEKAGVKLQSVWDMAFYVWLNYIPNRGNFIDADLIKIGVQHRIDKESSERHDTCLADIAMHTARIDAYREVIAMIDGGKYIN